MMQMYISQVLHTRCCNVLLRCSQFESHANLSVVFTIAELAPFGADLPETNNKRDRVEQCISHLLPKRRTEDDKSAFVRFLECIAERYDERDSLKQDLSRLAQDVDREMMFSPGAQQQKSSEARDYRDAIDNLGLTAGDPSQQQSHSAAGWLQAAKDDTDEWAFRIALAVFNGAQDNRFGDAARDLADRLRPPPPPAAPDAEDKPPPPAGPPIPPRRRERLERADACLEEVQVGTDAEARSMLVVKLRDQTLPFAALSYVWMEYDSWQPSLIDWLTTFAANQPADMRTRAGVAAGALALTDFAGVRDRVLLTWARQPANQAEYRAAISKALGVAVTDPRRQSEVRGLLKSWARSNDRGLRWAAARAYSYVGMHFPDEALEQWRIIALAEKTHVDLPLTETLFLRLHNPLHKSLVDAMLTFFLYAAEQPDRIQPVFEAGLLGLQRWVDADAQEDGQVGIGIFLFMMLTRVLMPGDADTEPGAWPPAMLALVNAAGPPSPYRKALVDLLFRALLQPQVYGEMLEILHEWMARVDQDTRYEPQMIAVLSDIVGHAGHNRRVWDRLMVRLRDWATSPQTPLRAARRAYNQLRLSLPGA